MEALPGTIKIRGKSGPVNAALAGLTYTGALEFNGQDVVVVTANDLGNSGEGGVMRTNKSISVIVAAVNDPPRLLAPPALDHPAGGTLFLAEDQSISLGKFGVIDPDDEFIRSRVSARIGRVTTERTSRGSLLVTAQDNESSDGGMDGSSVTFEGGAEEVSVALTTLTYKSPLNWNSVADDRDVLKVSGDNAIRRLWEKLHWEWAYEGMD